MSSTDARRMRRRMKRDIVKNIQGEERNLKIPTEEDIQKYINEKTNKMTYTPVEVLEPVDILVNNI